MRRPPGTAGSLNGAGGAGSAKSPATAQTDGQFPPLEGGPNARRGRFYQRRPFIVGAVVVAVLAVTIVTDLPQQASRGVQISNETAVMKEVNQYLTPCAYAVNETFTIYQEQTRHQLTPSDEATAPTLLRDDQAACSLTDQSMFDLGNVEVPGSAAGKQLQELVATVTLWATSDALAAIQAIELLWTDPTDASAGQQLSKAEGMLTADRKSALANLAKADSILTTHLPALKIPQLPNVS